MSGEIDCWYPMNANALIATIWRSSHQKAANLTRGVLQPQPLDGISRGISLNSVTWRDVGRAVGIEVGDMVNMVSNTSTCS